MRQSRTPRTAIILNLKKPELINEDHLLPTPLQEEEKVRCNT